MYILILREHFPVNYSEGQFGGAFCLGFKKGRGKWIMVSVLKRRTLNVFLFIIALLRYTLQKTGRKTEED